MARGEPRGHLSRWPPVRPDQLSAGQADPEARPLHVGPRLQGVRRPGPEGGREDRRRLSSHTQAADAPRSARGADPRYRRLPPLQQRLHRAPPDRLRGRFPGQRSGDRLQVPQRRYGGGAGHGRPAQHQRQVQDQVQARDHAAQGAHRRHAAAVVAQRRVRAEPGAGGGPDGDAVAGPHDPARPAASLPAAQGDLAGRSGGRLAGQPVHRRGAVAGHLPARLRPSHGRHRQSRPVAFARRSSLLRRRVRLPAPLRRARRHRPQGLAILRALLRRAAGYGRRLARAHHHQDRRGLSAEGQSSASARMSDSSASPATPAPSLVKIFWVFLVMGATSLGGGVVGYLRTGLVVRERWVDDVTFVELLSISQTLPGLNATNMAILIGDRLRGARGALLATLGMCLPSAILMTAAAFAYSVGGDDPWSKAFLHGIAAGAVGLVLVVMAQLGSKVLKSPPDYVFALATAVAVAVFGVKVPYALVAASAVAVWWHRPRIRRKP